MPESLDQEIRERLAQFLRGDESLAEFEAWLVPASWDLTPQSDPQAHELATAIQLRIAEFTGGDWTEDELGAHLEALLTPSWAVPSQIQTGASDTTTSTAQFSAANRQLG